MPLFDKNKPGIPKKSFLNIFKTLKNPRPLSGIHLTEKYKSKMGKEILADHNIKGSYVDPSELSSVQKKLEHKVMVTHNPVEKNKLKDKISMIDQLKKK